MLSYDMLSNSFQLIVAKNGIVHIVYASYEAKCPDASKTNLFL